MRAFLCWLGCHRLRKDAHPVNGVWWAFCDHCGARYAGTYDPAYGVTDWRPK